MNQALITNIYLSAPHHLSSHAKDLTGTAAQNSLLNSKRMRKGGKNAHEKINYDFCSADAQKHFRNIINRPLRKKIIKQMFHMTDK